MCFQNGVDVAFWLGIKDETELSREKRAEKQQLEQTLHRDKMQDVTNQETVDTQTGAVVTDEEQQELKGARTSSELTQTARLNLRAEQLKPILDRLKEQGSLTNPAQIVDIAGDVKYPGSYPLVVNADSNSLIKAAGGLLESAYTNSAELSRTGYENNELLITQQNVMLNSKGSDKEGLLLQAKDRLNILSKPGWNDELTLELQGEVMFPGRYTFKRGVTMS